MNIINIISFNIKTSQKQLHYICLFQTRIQEKNLLDNPQILFFLYSLSFLRKLLIIKRSQTRGYLSFDDPIVPQSSGLLES